MTSSAKSVLGAFTLIALIVATYALVRINQEKAVVLDEPTEHTYSSSVYGFSFSYPSRYRLAEFPSDRYVNIEVAGEEPNEVVSVAVEIAGEEQEYDDFLAYVHARAMVFCAADGPYESLRCTKVTRSEPFVTASGATGRVLYMEMEHSKRDETSYREVGPFYAFDITPSLDAPFAALIVRPARFFEESPAYDEGAQLAHDIVDSLRIAPR